MSTSQFDATIATSVCVIQREREYAVKKGWGHSSSFSVTDWAIQAGVKNLAIFHHDPEITDRDVDLKIQNCLQRAARLGGYQTIFAAREGVELKF